MRKINKGKCTNGHYFDLDKFAACPHCGAPVAEKFDSGKPSKKVVSVRQSRLADDTKTELLEPGNSDVPMSVKAGGITWQYNKVAQQEVDNHESADVPGQNEEGSAPVAGKPTEDVAAPEISVQQPEVQPVQKPAASALSQAVAATGYGKFSALPKTVAYSATPEVEIPAGWLVCVKGVYRGHAFTCTTGKNRIGRNPNCNINLIEDPSISREPHAIIIYDPRGKKFYLQGGDGSGLVYHNSELLFTHAELKAYDSIQIGEKAEFVFVPLCGEKFTWDDYLN